MKIALKAKAKINLFLHIIGKTPSNYHNLESLVCFPEEVFDLIEVEEHEVLKLEITGRFAQVLEIENNIIVKAANLLKADRKLGAKITLTKNLPIASGIGGGSSDAATTIKLLTKLWNIENPKENDLLSLGADVPCCYYGKATYFQGIGEILTPVSTFPKFYIVLVNPNKNINTGIIFKNLSKNYTEMLGNLPINFNDLNELVSFLKKQNNDMQLVARNYVEEIANIINQLQLQNNCLLARMSGSGATCFGIFANETDAKNAFLSIKENTKWWVDYSVVA